MRADRQIRALVGTLETAWHEGPLHAMAEIDARYAAAKVEAMERMVRPPVCPQFSLLPGSVNRAIIGASGAVYTGREMG